MMAIVASASPSRFEKKVSASRGNVPRPSASSRNSPCRVLLTSRSPKEYWRHFRQTGVQLACFRQVVDHATELQDRSSLPTDQRSSASFPTVQIRDVA